MACCLARLVSKPAVCGYRMGPNLTRTACYVDDRFCQALQEEIVGSVIACQVC